MKTPLLSLFVILTSLNIYAQGSGSGVIGFSSIGAPANKQVYVYNGTFPGTPADNRYSVSFHWSEGRDPWTFVQIGAPVDFLSGGGAGQFGGGNRTINGLSANGAVVNIQAKGWEKAYGNSYDAVVASGSGRVGVSPIVSIKTKDPNIVLETVPSLVNDSEWVAWTIGIPEPSIVALGLLGAGALFFLRNRRAP